jgi:hypothetical protein
MKDNVYENRIAKYHKSNLLYKKATTASDIMIPREKHRLDIRKEHVEKTVLSKRDNLIADNYILECLEDKTILDKTDRLIKSNNVNDIQTGLEYLSSFFDLDPVAVSQVKYSFVESLIERLTHYYTGNTIQVTHS